MVLQSSLQKQLSLDLTSLEDGLYAVLIQVGEQQVLKKMVIRRL
jgi:hypothetical protein